MRTCSHNRVFGIRYMTVYTEYSFSCLLPAAAVFETLPLCNITLVSLESRPGIRFCLDFRPEQTLDHSLLFRNHSLLASISTHAANKNGRLCDLAGFTSVSDPVQCSNNASCLHSAHGQLKQQGHVNE